MKDNISSFTHAETFIIIHNIHTSSGGARGVMVIIVGNGQRQPDFKPYMRLFALNIALIPLGKI